MPHDSRQEIPRRRIHPLRDFLEEFAGMFIGEVGFQYMVVGTVLDSTLFRPLAGRHPRDQ